MRYFRRGGEGELCFIVNMGGGCYFDDYGKGWGGNDALTTVDTLHYIQIY